jgi:hypothetical protein
VFPDGSVAWYDGTPVRAPELADPDTTAALVLLAVAREAAAAVVGLPRGSVEVTGSGLIARLVRALVGEAREAKARPRGIVDTTGDSDVIVDATRRLADFGVLVLACEVGTWPVELNLYSDVHLRGLTLIGVAPPMRQGESLFAENDGRDPGGVVPSLVRVTSGALLRRGLRGYRLTPQLSCVNTE